MLSIHIDIETYSSVDLRASGVYKYVESPDFEILMIAFAYNSKPPKIIDLKQGESIPDYLKSAMVNPEVTKKAHNAVFERLCFRAIGLDISADQWECTQVKAAYCGLPLALDQVSKALQFDESKAKDSKGKALIRYFSMPCKPTKKNEGRTRNLPHHDPVKWEAFKDYCIQDVEAERAIDSKLEPYLLPDFEKRYYSLDQKINDLGVNIDLPLVKKATVLDKENTEIAIDRMKDITGLDNPNSLAQLKNWLSLYTSEKIETLRAEDVSQMIEATDDQTVREVLSLRQVLSKSSVKKYYTILDCVCKDGRGHGFFQFYGANRTGRWAGRLVQLHNLVRNKLSALGNARGSIKQYSLDVVEILHGDLSYLLSQLVRTNFIASKGNTLAVADFSAIEARVTAWLAGETWRLDVFDTHGKIYEASAASMFNIPLESIGKGSELRQKGKIAELALGYQGGVGALCTMGADKMGLSTNEMKDIIKRWRKASPAIVEYWKSLENAAKQAIKSRGSKFSVADGKISFVADGDFLMMILPSGRKLYYYDPRIKKKVVKKDNGETWEAQSITYMGLNQVTRQWSRIDTYGGKLLENACQAISRDLLANSMVSIDDRGYDIVMHVHDEAVCDIKEREAEQSLDDICRLMEVRPGWAEDLALVVEGYLTPFYLKD